jgi:hypothetical protein
MEYLAPFRDDARALRWQGFTTPPDRVRRIAVFAEEYGLATGAGLVEAVIRQQQLTGNHVRAWPSEGWNHRAPGSPTGSATNWRPACSGPRASATRKGPASEPGWPTRP